MEVVTKEDLEIFRVRLIDDIKKLITPVQNKTETPQWLKSKEVRTILHASPGTLQNLRISGKLNPVKIAGTWYYSSTEVNSLFNNPEAK